MGMVRPTKWLGDSNSEQSQAASCDERLAAVQVWLDLRGLRFVEGLLHFIGRTSLISIGLNRGLALLLGRRCLVLGGGV